LFSCRPYCELIHGKRLYIVFTYMKGDFTLISLVKALATAFDKVL
jgi:hypothetical protein